MYFSKHFIFVAAAVLAVFTNQSDAGLNDLIVKGADLVQTIGSIAVDIVGDGVSVIRESIENQFNEARLHISAERTKAAIRRQASDARTVSVNNQCIDATLKGLIDAIDYIVETENAGLDGLKAAREASRKDVAIKAIEEGFAKANQGIVFGGGAIYLGIGASTKLCHAGASKGLNEGIQITTTAGIAAFAGFASAKSLAIQGIEAGKDATDQAFMASLKGIQSTVDDIYQIVIKARKKSFDSIKKESVPVNQTSEVDLVKERAATKSAKCQAAIQAINQSAAQATKAVVAGPKFDAIIETRDGLIDACKIIALAAQPSYLTIETIAKNSSSKDAATAAVTKAIADSKKVCVAAVSSAHQALGAAAQIVGGSNLRYGLFVAMTIVETSRNEMFKGLESSLVFLTQGIESDAPESGLQAGREAVASATFTGLTVILKAAEYAFQQILSA